MNDKRRAGVRLLLAVPLARARRLDLFCSLSLQTLAAPSSCSQRPELGREHR
jgi:hypothetical protein